MRGLQSAPENRHSRPITDILSYSAVPYPRAETTRVDRKKPAFQFRFHISAGEDHVMLCCRTRMAFLRSSIAPVRRLARKQEVAFHQPDGDGMEQLRNRRPERGAKQNEDASIPNDLTCSPSGQVALTSSRVKVWERLNR